MSGIQGSAPCIHLPYYDMEQSAPMAQSLVDEVNAMKVGQSILFNWDTRNYTNPSRVVAPTTLANLVDEPAE